MAVVVCLIAYRVLPCAGLCMQGRIARFGSQLVHQETSYWTEERLIITMLDIEHIQEIETVASGARSQRDHVVLDSWLRCINEYKLDPSRQREAYIVPDTQLREHRQQSEELINIARTGIEELFRQPTHYWPRVIDLIATGRIPAREVVTKKVSLEQAVTEGFDALLSPSGEQLKILIDLNNAD